MRVKIASICPSIESGIFNRKLQFRFVPAGTDASNALAVAEANLLRIVPLLEQAADAGARIACLPEDLMGLIHWSMAPGRRAAVRRTVLARAWKRFCGVLSAVARRREMIVCAGAYEVGSNGRCYNAAALFDHRGRLLGSHRKVHLAGAERRVLTPGDCFPVYRTRYGRIGMCICWDIIFPESTQALMVNGADLILQPTWGHSDTHADDTVQARARDACTPIVVSMWCGGGRIVDRDGAILAATDAPRNAKGLIPDQIVYADVDPRAKRAWLGCADHKQRLLRQRQPAAYRTRSRRAVRSILTMIVMIALNGQLGHAQAANPLPSPGIGVFFKSNEVAAIRQKISRPPCQATYEKILKAADDGLAKWPEDKTKLRIPELAPQMVDLQMEFTPDQYSPPGSKEASKALNQYANGNGPSAAFVYLMTGDRKYADFAWDVFEQCAKANRWGWYPWNGGPHMPQIHYGILSRNLVLIADCVWDTLTPQQRQHAREVIAEKCVEPYYRIVMHSPGLGLNHLRAGNQGNNAISAALIGSVFVGDAVADNKIWFNSILQSYHWIITDDIGWMGGHVESGMPGYWSVSMQNLYTAAVVLNNKKGIDLRGHPGFEQATYYPIIHESTVPAVDAFTDPINPNPTNQPVMGVIAGKPIELPHDAYCGPWWLDYAVNFPDTPAHYFASKLMISSNSVLTYNAHQSALGDVLTIAWWNDKLLSPSKPPISLAQFTDRMAGIRSGYRFGDTFLYFNGDLFLSAKKEILCTTAGMSWHFPWHKYAITETGIETEGEPFAPSMVIKEVNDDSFFAFFRAESGLSNVAYYGEKGQRDSYKHYEKRERSVLYVRGDKARPDYFLILDDVKEKDPRWHAWTWHLWNSAANPKNYGRFVAQGDNAVRAERPNADLWIQFLTPGKVAVEQHGIPSQPHVSYEMDHNAQMLRAIAGQYQPVTAKSVTIPPSAWHGEGVVQADALYLEKPPTGQWVSDVLQPTITMQPVKGIVGGVRYRWSVKCKEEDYLVYEATKWSIDLELLDANGKVVAKPMTGYGHPDPLRLGAPLSNTPTHDWAETVQYFDAPADAVACRASFVAIGGAHNFRLGKLWLSPIELQPVGIPERQTAQKFLTLVMPLDKGSLPPKIETNKDGRTRITHPDGSKDEITLTPQDTISITRHKSFRVVARFPDPKKQSVFSSDTLKSNSDASAKALTVGFKPVLEEIAAERDSLTKTGRKNLALTAKVTASATRDERFAAARVVDNQAAEYPTDGHLDYKLGTIETSGDGIWPLWVKPTYWLLPIGSDGWIELELKMPAVVDHVRLLNTSNAGLNDFATETVRIELYGRNHKLVTNKEETFGKAFDRSFQQAFFIPQWFNSYGDGGDRELLKPGRPVPFGDGWKEIAFDNGKEIAFVRIVITKYWGIGGGLNEVQIYGK